MYLSHGKFLIKGVMVGMWREQVLVMVLMWLEGLTSTGDVSGWMDTHCGRWWSGKADKHWWCGKVFRGADKYWWWWWYDRRCWQVLVMKVTWLEGLTSTDDGSKVIGGADKDQWHGNNSRGAVKLQQLLTPSVTGAPVNISSWLSSPTTCMYF